MADNIDNSEKHLPKWGLRAKQFLEMIEDDLMEAHRTWERCYGNCSLSLLDLLETLDDWEGI